MLAWEITHGYSKRYLYRILPGSRGEATTNHRQDRAWTGSIASGRSPAPQPSVAGTCSTHSTHLSCGPAWFVPGVGRGVTPGGSQGEGYLPCHLGMAALRGTPSSRLYSWQPSVVADPPPRTWCLRGDGASPASLLFLLLQR